MLNRIASIASIILAGLVPIIMGVTRMYSYFYWMFNGEYIHNTWINITDPSMNYLFVALVLSISNNYCRYHSLGIISLIAQGVLSLNSAHLSIDGDFTIYNLIVLSLNIFSIVMMVYVFIHIYQQIAKHQQKLRIFFNSIFYGFFQRIIRRIRSCE